MTTLKEKATRTKGMFDQQSTKHRDTGSINDDQDISKKKKTIYIYKNKLSVDLWIVDQVTSPEKTGSGDVKTEKTKKRQKLQKKLKTNKKNKKAKKLKKLKKGKNYKKN